MNGYVFLITLMYFFFFNQVFIATKANPWGGKGVFLTF